MDLGVKLKSALENMNSSFYPTSFFIYIIQIHKILKEKEVLLGGFYTQGLTFII